NLQRQPTDQIHWLPAEADLLDHGGAVPYVPREHGELSGSAGERSLVLHCLNSVASRCRACRYSRTWRQALDQAARRSAFPTFGMDQDRLDLGVGQILL